MGILEGLVKAEQKIQRRIDRIFGRGAAATPLEMRREILDRVEDHIVVRGGKRLFPFDRICVHLLEREADKRAILSAAFEEEDALAGDIRQLLKKSGCELPADLEITLDFAESEEADAVPVERFRLEFVRARRQAPARRQGSPDAKFAVVKGTAEQPVYRLTKEHIQIGRLGELLDREGHVVRRNDVAFLDNGEDVNSTVGRAHATVTFNREKGEFRIVDELSRYGTRIFRDGRPIAVPGGNARGIRLRSGDEIYLGHACIRFSCGD
jgi:hypothetical protein